MLENLKIVSQDDWDNNVMPAVESGEIKERKDLQPKGFLYVYQVFNSVLEENGKLYRVSGWGHPQQKNYVEVEPL